jgi:hypothetical protein
VPAVTIEDARSNLTELIHRLTPGTEVLITQNEEPERLFNPRTQIWADHFELCGPLIVGRTGAGRNTVRVLSMNAGQRLQLRAALIAHGLYP